MRMLISPAKKMKVDCDSLPPASLPQFLPETEQIKAALDGMTDAALQKLWRCSESLARENIERLRRMDLRRQLTPAILSYEGIQYRYMAPGVFEEAEFAYLNEHLRILSGFYGLLRPFDGITSYRLEMQAKLQVNKQANLYAFWGSRLAEALLEESHCIIDLASQEYSKVIAPHVPRGFPYIRCTFAEILDGRLLEQGTLCKMARGQMVRFLTTEGITKPDDLRAFCDLGFAYERTQSDPLHYVFIRGGSPC